MRDFAELHLNLLNWYEKSGRHSLIWRQTENLYHIYVSEIMLQQTQVSRVESHFYPLFLEKFPTLQALADATQEEVLSIWSGLGYYSRARNLHKCAKLAAPNLPQTKEELLKLPGIGRYTASAICSFGLCENIPVVDTNIARVLKRLFALQNPSETLLWRYAGEFVNQKAPRCHNLAIMDLGSLVCLPKKPLCESCPLQKECKGKEQPLLYTQSKKKEYESLELFYGVCIKENKIALQTSKTKLYRDMLVLPDVDPIDEDFLGSFKHSYTKYRLRVNLYKVEELKNRQLIWLDLEEIQNAAVSSLTKKAQTLFEKIREKK